jgi:hypothetical protein
VVAPVGYRTSKNGRQYYRQPAYLLTTDLTADARVLLQAYFRTLHLPDFSRIPI